MIKRISKAELEQQQRNGKVRVTRQPRRGPKTKPSPPPAPAAPPVARADPDIKALLAKLTELAALNNLTLDQLARIAAKQSEKPTPRPRLVLFEGIEELRVTERASDGSIKAIKPIMKVRH